MYQSQAEKAIAAGKTLRRPVVEFEHPIVRTHPVTGRKALFVNSGFTKRIKQLSVTESGASVAYCFTRIMVVLLTAIDCLDTILRFLFNHVVAGHEFQVRYHWTKNAVAIWDNRATIHNATFDYLPGNRHAVRVTPHGEIPFFASEASKSNDATEAP